MIVNNNRLGDDIVMEDAIRDFIIDIDKDIQDIGEKYNGDVHRGELYRSSYLDVSSKVKAMQSFLIKNYNTHGNDFKYSGYIYECDIVNVYKTITDTINKDIGRIRSLKSSSKDDDYDISVLMTNIANVGGARTYFGKSVNVFSDLQNYCTGTNYINRHPTIGEVKMWVNVCIDCPKDAIRIDNLATALMKNVRDGLYDIRKEAISTKDKIYLKTLRKKIKYLTRVAGVANGITISIRDIHDYQISNFHARCKQLHTFLRRHGVKEGFNNLFDDAMNYL